jgi:hypothetical protein
MIQCSICSYQCALPRHATPRRHAGNGNANANANADADADTALYHFPFNAIRFRTLLLSFPYDVPFNFPRFSTGFTG